jgi:fatty acid desaturase
VRPDDDNRRTRRLLSVIGLVCVALSLALNFIAPGTWWNWALLLPAAGALLLSRRYQ